VRQLRPIEKSEHTAALKLPFVNENQPVAEMILSTKILDLEELSKNEEVLDTMKLAKTLGPVADFSSTEELEASLSIRKRNNSVSETPSADIVISGDEFITDEHKAETPEKDDSIILLPTTEITHNAQLQTELSSELTDVSARIQDILERVALVDLPDFISLHVPDLLKMVEIATEPVLADERSGISTAKTPEETNVPLTLFKVSKPLTDETSEEVIKPINKESKLDILPEAPFQIEQPKITWNVPEPVEEEARVKLFPKRNKLDTSVENEQNASLEVSSEVKFIKDVSHEASFQVAPSATKTDTDEESESLSLIRRPKRRSLDEEMKEVQVEETVANLVPNVLEQTANEQPTTEQVVFTRGISERVTFEEEEDVELVVITNTETPVQWIFSSYTITSSDDNYTVIQEGLVHRLIIHKITKSKAGRYTCKTETVETSGTIIVRDKPAKFIDTLHDQTANLGEEIVLMTKVSRKDVNVTWKKLRKTIHGSTKYIIAQDEETHTLIIKNADLEDSGVYTCQVEDETTTCKIKVQAVPKFNAENLPASVLLDLGQIYRSEIPFVGAPEPEVELLLNGDKISLTDKVTYRIEQHHVTIVLKKVEQRDSGRYFLRIFNELGDDIFEFTVAVLGEFMDWIGNLILLSILKVQKFHISILQINHHLRRIFKSRKSAEKRSRLTGYNLRWMVAAH
jgi:Immunoglobulin I-set domain